MPIGKSILLMLCRIVLCFVSMYDHSKCIYISIHLSIYVSNIYIYIYIYIYINFMT